MSQEDQVSSIFALPDTVKYEFEFLGVFLQV